MTKLKGIFTNYSVMRLLKRQWTKPNGIYTKILKNTEENGLERGNKEISQIQEDELE